MYFNNALHEGEREREREREKERERERRVARILTRKYVSLVALRRIYHVFEKLTWSYNEQEIPFILL